MARTKDRRRESRLPYRATIDATFGSESFTGRETRDISITGTFIEGLSGPKKGDTCNLLLQLKGEASDLHLKLKAEVVRIEEKGLALEFLDVTRDCFYHLKNIAYVIQTNPDDIICTNYKKPKKSKVVVLEEFDHSFDAGDEDEYD